MNQIVLPVPSRFPLVILRDTDEQETPLITVTAVYPDDGALGSVTFDTVADKARGALFLTSQNGNDAEEIPVGDILMAVNAVLNA